MLMAEKRAAHRVPVRVRARFETPSTVIEGWVTDVSRLGLFLRANLIDANGMRGTIDLDLPQREPLRLPCEVVRVVAGTDGGLGMRFGEIPEATRRPLANFMIESSYHSVR